MSSYITKEDYYVLQKMLESDRHCILSKLIKELYKIHEKLDEKTRIYIFCAIIHLKKSYDSHNMPAEFYIRAKHMWNNFINDNKILSNTLKTHYIITNNFY